MKRRKICVVTGSRADYAHLFWLLREIQGDNELALQIIVSGMHLSKRFGLTYRNIIGDGFRISEKVDLLRFDNSETGVTKSIGEGCKRFADVFRRLKPDLVVIFADRFEMLAASIAAYLARIPIAHIHGGETTQGAVDEAIRHSITKMASIHFVATAVYRKRVIQLGEEPQRVFHFGSPSIDAIYHEQIAGKCELSARLGMALNGYSALVTYHPVTLEKDPPHEQIKNLLDVISQLNLEVIFTKSNADTHGEIINEMIAHFCHRDPCRYKLFDCMGSRLYFSCLKHCTLMVGNSSSGLVEAPSFKIPVVNIGDRQKGRIRARNVIDVGCSKKQIQKGIQRALSGSFRLHLKDLKNPYEKYKDGRISFRIKEKLKNLKIDGHLLKKRFNDIDFLLRE